MWATPRASEGFRGSDPERTNPESGLQGLKGQVASRHAPTTPTDGGSGSPTADLNPAFVECLMGLPVGWSDPLASLTGCTCSVTGSSPSAPAKPCACSQKGR
jgi:hypothetical protein